MNKRLNVKIILGIERPELSKLVTDMVIKRISKKYGGCTHYEGTGYWAENGSEFTNSYDNIAKEEAQIIEVSMLPEDYSQSELAEMVEPASRAKCDWVHVELQEVYADHFSLAEVC